MVRVFTLRSFPAMSFTHTPRDILGSSTTANRTRSLRTRAADWAAWAYGREKTTGMVAGYNKSAGSYRHMADFQYSSRSPKFAAPTAFPDFSAHAAYCKSELPMISCINMVMISAWCLAPANSYCVGGSSCPFMQKRGACTS